MTEQTTDNETTESTSEVADLVRRLQAGDTAALEPLVEQFDPMLRAVAWQIVRNATDTADVVQEAWLRLLTACQTLTSPEYVFAWLRTTTRRIALETIRHRNRLTSLDAATYEGVAIDPEDWPDARAERRDRNVRVRRALDMMHHDRSALLVDLVCTDASYREVGRRWSRPVGSLGPTRARHLCELRQHLASQGVDAR